MYESILSQPQGLFGQFERLRRELDDVFGLTGSPSSIRSVAPGTWPAVNIGRTPASIEVYAFAPGLDASQIDVTLDRGVLRISGVSTPNPKADANTHVYARERSNGRFSRTISLPDDIDPGQVNAQYRDGVIRVTVGRRETPQPKRISVQ